jgi:hypothetical protein
MANSFYPQFKDSLMRAEQTLTGHAIQCFLIDSAYYAYGADHYHIGYISPSARVANVQLSGQTLYYGTFDTGDFSWTNVSGNISENIILWNASTTWLISFYDTGTSGLPVTPNGGNINVTVSASGWFTL